jgi:hypothetical protein
MPPPYTTPSLDEVLEFYYSTVVSRASDDAVTDVARLRAFVRNQQHDDRDDEYIYDEVAKFFPYFGCPLAFYNENAGHIIEENARTMKLTEKARKSREAGDHGGYPGRVGRPKKTTVPRVRAANPQRPDLYIEYNHRSAGKSGVSQLDATDWPRELRESNS